LGAAQNKPSTEQVSTKSRDSFVLYAQEEEEFKMRCFNPRLPKLDEFSPSN